MILICEKDPSRLAAIASVKGLERDLEQFNHLKVEVVDSVALSELLARVRLEWEQGWGKPIQFHGDGGWAFFKLSETGLSYLVEHADDLPEAYRGDLRKLAEFVRRHGKSDIYELV